MLGRQGGEFPSQKTEPGDKNWFSRWEPPVQGLASKATDLETLRTTVVDAAGVGYGLWFSYLFALLYFAIAAGAVTHRDLLLESPVKLPFLNVELPLKAFFILGPLVFLVVHAYVLLHFLLLAGKVGAFHTELQNQIPEDEKRAQLRRQLPSNIFVQFLAGPREVRSGIVGFLLKSVATISLVAGPIALLVLFQLQFLPYHNPWITWWQRIAVLLDLVLLWLLWPPIARGETRLLRWNDLGRMKVATWVPPSLLPLLLVFAIATFPGEWLEETLPEVPLVPIQWPTWESTDVEADGTPANQPIPTQQETETAKPRASNGSFLADSLRRTGEIWRSMGWTSPHKLLVAGEVNYVTGKADSLWSNRLILPHVVAGEQLRLDPEGRIGLSPEAVSLRGRQLGGAVLVGAHLRKADFTGAVLGEAIFRNADLREANFGCVDAYHEVGCAQLQRADLSNAQLQGASLIGAQLQGASLQDAKLRGASLDMAELESADLSNAQLQGASLYRTVLQGASFIYTELQGASLSQALLDAAWFDQTQLQGAKLDRAQLQGASLSLVQLQGASLRGAELQGASLDGALVWRADPPQEKQLEGALIEELSFEPKYLGLDCPAIGEETCDWTDAAYAALKARIETAPSTSNRDAALKRIEALGQKPYKEDAASAKVWRDLATKSQSAQGDPVGLAKTLIRIGCNADSFVISALIGQLDQRFQNNPSQKVEVAKAFLDEPNCPGVQGLDEEKKSELRRILDPALPRWTPGRASR